MIYLFGNYRALGVLGSIDNKTQERGWRWEGGDRLRDLTFPPTSVVLCVCTLVSVCVFVCTLGYP